MIRSELCKITEIEISTFNSHRRNGDLPFEMTSGTSSLEVVQAGRVWARFDIWHAALLIAAKQLSERQGITWSEAARLLRSKPEGTLNSGPFSPFMHSKIFRAFVTFATSDSDRSPERLENGRAFQGTLSNIVATAEMIAESHGRFQPSGLPVVIDSIAAVNLSECLALAKRQAAKEGVDFASDDLTPEPSNEV